MQPRHHFVFGDCVTVSSSSSEDTCLNGSQTVLTSNRHCPISVYGPSSPFSFVAMSEGPLTDDKELLLIRGKKLFLVVNGTLEFRDALGASVTCRAGESVLLDPLEGVVLNRIQSRDCQVLELHPKGPSGAAALGHYPTATVWRRPAVAPPKPCPQRVVFQGPHGDFEVLVSRSGDVHTAPSPDTTASQDAVELSWVVAGTGKYCITPSDKSFVGIQTERVSKNDQCASYLSAGATTFQDVSDDFVALTMRFGPCRITAQSDDSGETCREELKQLFKNGHFCSPLKVVYM